MKYVISVLLCLVLLSGTFAMLGINIGYTYTDAIKVVNLLPDVADNKVINTLLGILDFGTGSERNLQSSYFKLNSSTDSTLISQYPLAFRDIVYCVRLPLVSDVYLQNHDFLNYLLKDTFGVNYKHMSDTDIFLCFDKDGIFRHFIIFYNNQFSYTDRFSYCLGSMFQYHIRICDVAIEEVLYGEIYVTRYKLETSNKGSFSDMMKNYT